MSGDNVTGVRLVGEGFDMTLKFPPLEEGQEKVELSVLLQHNGLDVAPQTMYRSQQAGQVLAPESEVTPGDTIQSSKASTSG